MLFLKSPPSGQTWVEHWALMYSVWLCVWSA